MTYVLIQWVSERKWDVYPISCIEDASVGYRLYTDKKCIGELRGTVVNVRWDKHKEPEPATLLDVGKQQRLELKRADLVRNSGADITPTATDLSNPEQNTQSGEVESQKKKINELEKENTDLKEENEQLKRALQDAENHHESYRMVKKLKTIVEKMESTERNVVRPSMVDIDSAAA